MFAIRLLPPDCQGTDGERLGEIVVGDFQERFSCYPVGGAFGNFEANWRAELVALAHGGPVALLRHDPRLAWLVYREGDECLVQQRLSTNGEFTGLLPRTVTTDDGDELSTWATTVAAIRQFLDAESRCT